jgi:PAS domain S-box-containing protein
MKSIKTKIFSQNTDPESLELRNITLAVLIASVIGAFGLALLNINRNQMLLLGLILGISLLMASRGRLFLARWFSLFSAFFVVSTLLYRNQGIRDTAVFGLIVILISAGLMAGKSGTLLIGSITFTEIALFGFLETSGVIINKFSEFNHFADYAVICLCIILITILQWMTISKLNKNTQSAKQELKDRLSMEIQLRDAETRYRNLVEKIPVVIYIAEPGDTGRWQYVSPQIFALTGYTPEEWTTGAHLWYSRIHPEDRLRVLQDEKNALGTGTMPQLEYRFLTRDGRYIWIYDESLLTLDSDQRGMVQGFMLDITARKSAEEQLQHRLSELEAMRGVSEALTAQSNLYNLIEKTGNQVRQTYKASTMYIAIYDPATNLIHFPYDYEDDMRQEDDPIPYGKGLTSQIMEMGRPLLVTSNWEEEVSKYNPIYRNKKRPKSSISIPMMIRERAIGVISMDNTEIENAFTENDVRLLSTIAANLAVAIENTRLQESLKKELGIQEKLVFELERKNEELERFTYTASHDLKSPLITIRGFLGYIEQDARAGNFERLQSDMQRISDATDKMHRLLNELLDLSRVGRTVNKAEDVPFVEIVQDALGRVEGQLKEKQVTVKLGSEFPIVHVDRERFVEVLQNLIDNAVKFMGNQGKPEIEIDTKVKNGQTLFFVKDNGVGIRKEFHEKVFGLFDKLDSESDGTGVGLALVKRIIEVQGGKIWIESEEGKGSTFFFTLESK